MQKSAHLHWLSLRTWLTSRNALQRLMLIVSVFGIVISAFVASFTVSQADPSCRTVTERGFIGMDGHIGPIAYSSWQSCTDYQIENVNRQSLGFQWEMREGDTLYSPAIASFFVGFFLTGVAVFGIAGWQWVRGAKQNEQPSDTASVNDY